MTDAGGFLLRLRGIEKCSGPYCQTKAVGGIGATGELTNRNALNLVRGAVALRCVETGDRTRTTVVGREDRTGKAVRGGHWSIPNHSRSQPAHSAMPAISDRKARRRMAPRMFISGGLALAYRTLVQRVHLDRRESLGLGGAARSNVSYSLRAEVAALRDHAHWHAAVAQVLNELLPCDVHGADHARRAVARQAS